MREFEEALKRARAGVATPPPETSPAESPQLSQPAPRLPEIRRDSGNPSIAALPPLQADVAFFRENFGSHAGDSAVVDGAFRILRTRVLEEMHARGGKVLGITSPGPGAGKTVTALHLALACARRPEQSVVLADFDLRRPAAAQYLDARGFKPSIDYFRGEGRATDYLYRNEAGNLAYMLTDRSTEMSAEHLASSRFDRALDELRGLADNVLIILDLPPMTGCDDTLAVLPKLDGILLVVAAGESRFSQLEESVSLLPKEKLVGTVLNKAPHGSGSYDYY